MYLIFAKVIYSDLYIKLPWFLTKNIFLLNYQICRNSNTELNMLENESIVLLSDLQIYNPLLADVPTWFQTSVISFFSILMSIGIFLNGFVVGCFAFSPNVSNWSKSLALLQNDCNIHYGYHGHPVIYPNNYFYLNIYR